MAASLAVATGYAVHGFHVLRTAIDAPFLDDWSLTRWGHLGWVEWLVVLHVDHPLLFTKLLTSTMDLLGGWDVRIHRWINWALYGLEVLLFCRVLVVACRGGDRWAARQAWIPVVFATTMVTTFNHLNHEWAIQTSYHLFVIFTLGAALGIQRMSIRRSGRGSWILTCLCAVAVPQTLAAGMVVAPVILVILALSHLRSGQPRRIVAWPLLLLGASSSAGSVTRYLAGGTLGSLAEAVSPGASAQLFVRLVGRSLTPGSHELLSGTVTLALIALLVTMLARRPATIGHEVRGPLLALFVALGFLALVAWGRNLQAIHQNQYAEIQAMVPALLATLSLLALADSRRLCIGLLLVLAVAVGSSHLQHFDYRMYYERSELLHRQTVECAARRWRGWAPRNCAWVFPPSHDFTSGLAQARRDRTTLYQRTRPGGEAPPGPVRLANGKIERATENWAHLELRGWTLEEGEVVLYSNGRLIEPEAVDRFPRRRLARRHGLPPQRPIGFAIVIDRDAVPTAALDGVRVLIDDGASLHEVGADFYLEEDNAVWGDGRRLPRADGEMSNAVLGNRAGDRWAVSMEPAPDAREAERLSAVVLWRDRWVPVDVEARAGSTDIAITWEGTWITGETVHAAVLLVPQRGFHWLEPAEE